MESGFDVKTNITLSKAPGLQRALKVQRPFAAGDEELASLAADEVRLAEAARHNGDRGIASPCEPCLRRERSASHPARRAPGGDRQACLAG